MAERNFARSRLATDTLEKIIPGGAHAYARGADQFPEAMPVVIARGCGCEVWDLDGNSYLEFGMGLRSVLLGHAYPAVNEAAFAAMNLGVNFIRPSQVELECAEMMLELVPGMDMVKFAKNGSDVTTAAIRLARAATGRDKVALCAEHPFFSVDDWFIGTTPMNAGIPDSVSRLTATFRYGDLGSFETLLEDEPGAYACAILEPEKYETAPPGYLQGLRKLCNKHGVCLIFDEMITGFRHHFGGVHLRDGVRPDMVTYGKAIANGFSNSALLGRRELMRLGGFDHDDPRVFLLSTTHGAETHALAATMATMQVLQEEDVLSQIAAMGRRLTAGVEAIAGELGIRDHFKIIGLPTDLVYLSLDADGNPSQEFRTLFLQESMKRGLLAPSFVLSFSHTSAVIDRVLDILRDVLAVYSQALESGVDRFLSGRPVRPAFRKFR